MRPRTIEIAGRRYSWRELLELRRAQATQKAQQPALFDLREDRRPPGERTPAERYNAPSLFTWNQP
jgi:hypothetical protein